MSAEPGATDAVCILPRVDRSYAEQPLAQSQSQLPQRFLRKFVPGNNLLCWDNEETCSLSGGVLAAGIVLARASAALAGETYALSTSARALCCRVALGHVALPERAVMLCTL